ncbi:MAG: ferrous iron transport protein A [bacterium]|jgi:Fe2+ transport system protein FeoA|nr:ferrous iron transport protein A [Bacillota bacterium]HHW55007.1 ferrous iron transport protein A [Bacillota bacterium]
MTLDQAQRGQVLQIRDIKEQRMRVQALRFGLTPGCTIQCVETLPAGPVIVRRNRQELALGRGLARLVVVEPAAAEDSGRS